METLELDQWQVRIDGPLHQPGPVLWAPVFNPQQAQAVGRSMEKDCVTCCVYPQNGDADFSPWPAPPAFRGGAAFAGGGAAFLNCLTARLIPQAERRLGFSVSRRGIVGYSLAGLFALYALHCSPLFQMAGSISGSLWYDGWEDYALTHTPPAPVRLYLSLGDREEKTRNPRLAAVGGCTRRLAGFWAQRHPLLFETTRGGHFDDPEGRMLQGMRWLIAAD